MIDAGLLVLIRPIGKCLVAFFSTCPKRGQKLSIWGSSALIHHHNDNMLTCLNSKFTVAFFYGLLGKSVMSGCTIDQAPASRTVTGKMS